MRPERCFTGPSPTQRSPRDSPRVLSHGLFREYQRRRGLGPRTGQHQDLPPQGISLKSVTTLRQLAAERGRIPERARRMWCGSTKRLSSVDHFLRIKAVHRLAREDLKKATVYRMTDSGEAGAQIRESNRIQRYNIWKMGQAAWKWARQAAVSGDSTLDERQYFLAKRRYLQCLSRLDKQVDTQVDTQVDERAERS